MQKDVIPKFKDLKESQESENIKSDSAISVLGTYIEPKEYNGQRVVTFKDIDRVHQRPDGTARKRFNDNKEHFVEGEDFYTVKPSDFQMSEKRTSGIFAEDINNRGTTFITETGYLMLVKSFTDSLSWQVQRQLVNVYFRAKQIADSGKAAQCKLSCQLTQTINAAKRRNQQCQKSRSASRIMKRYTKT